METVIKCNSHLNVLYYLHADIVFYAKISHREVASPCLYKYTTVTHYSRLHTKADQPRQALSGKEGLRRDEVEAEDGGADARHEGDQK
jgi:hypothetical protein